MLVSVLVCVGCAGSGSISPQLRPGACASSVVGVLAGTTVATARAGMVNDVFALDDRLVVRQLTTSGRALAPVIDAAGDAVAFLQSGGAAARGPQELWFTPLTGSAPKPRLLLHGQQLQALALAPNGRDIAVGSTGAPVSADTGEPAAGGPASDDASAATRELSVVDTATGGSTLVTRLDGSGDVTTTAWSPEGSRLAFTTVESSGGAARITLSIGDPRGRTPPRTLATLPGSAVAGIDWSGDGSAILVRATDRGVTTSTVEVSSGEVTPVPGAAALFSVEFGASPSSLVGLVDGSDVGPPVLVRAVTSGAAVSTDELPLSRARSLDLAACALGDGQ